MEYSKEDLMEAKKQIWGVGENMGTYVKQRLIDCQFKFRLDEPPDKS